MTFNFLPKENLQYFLNQIKNKLDLKVDKVSGKTLSTNDLTNSLKISYDDAVNKKHTHANKAVLDNTTASFTTEEKTKLSGIAAGAQANVQSDWDETTTSSAAFIKNKPTIPSATSQLKNDSDYTTSEFVTNALKSKVDIKEGWDLSENNLTAALITKINNADAKAHTHSNYATLENIEEAYTTAEKNKLKNIAAGAQVNSITGVKGNSETEYRTGNVNITKANIGLGSVDNTTDVNKPVSTAQQKAIDAAYANSNKYTDKKIADLINGAPETMDTLKEVSDAINASKSVEEALNKAIGTKANQTELDTHTGNDTIHITATERTNWNDANSKKHSHANKTTLDGITADKVASWDKISNKLNEDGNASNTTIAFKEATTRTNLTTGEKISISFGKIAKWFSDLKTVAFTGSYTDLTNKPTIPTNNNQLTNGAGYITSSGTAKTISDTLPISKDGTGKTTGVDAANTLINSLDTGSETPTDNDFYISQYVGGGTTTRTYHRRPMSALWNYIKSKLATVATSGSYNDLSNKPTIPSVGNGTVTITQNGTSKGTFTMNQNGNTTIALTDTNTDTWRPQPDWNATSGDAVIKNKPSLAKVATSGSYNDLSNKPTIPTIPSSLPANGGNSATVNGHTVNSDVPANAKFTDTWRDVVDNLSSTRTDASLSANQGRILGAKLPFAFGIDADGNYGYYKAGADTVTPFKTGDKIINSRFPNGKSLVGLDSFVLTSNGKTYKQGSTITISENTTKIGDNKVPNGSIRIYNKSGGANGMAFTPDYIDLTDINFIFTSSVYADTHSSSHTGFHMKLTIVDENGNGTELATTGLGFSNTIKQGNLCANVYGYSGKYKIGYRAAFPEAGYVDIFYFGLY